MRVDWDKNDQDKAAPDSGAGDSDCVAIVVCTSCRDENGSDSRPRPGEHLADDARRAAAVAGIRVETVECLGNCKRRLSAAIVKQGGWSYVFGDLDATSGDDLVAGAELFATSETGVMPWRDRPQSLKRGLVARIPPIFTHKDSLK